MQRKQVRRLPNLDNEVIQTGSAIDKKVEIIIAVFLLFP